LIIYFSLIDLIFKEKQTNMADSVIEPAENSSANVAPVEDLLQTASLQNCQRLVVLGSARSGKSSLVAR
jgi:hypothetical protein